MRRSVQLTAVAGAIGCLTSGSLATKGSGKATALRFLSYNVRYDSLPDNVPVAETIESLPSSIPEEPSPFYGGADVEAPWSTRRIQVANDIIFNSVDFFGGQEFLIRQLDDLQELLGDDYAHIGIGRNGGNESEFSPIFYKPSVAKLESWDTFWLSETPFDISFFPGTTNRRICTTAKFTTSSGPLIFLNTHLDHEIEDQRRYGMSLILHRAKFEAIKSGGAPVVLTGDFNSPATGEDSGGYQIVTGAAEPLPLNETFLEKYSWTPEEEEAANIGDEFVMEDLLGATPPRYRSGHWATFTGFEAAGNASSFSRIDYVMAGSNGGWEAKAFRVGETLYDNGVYSSDHRPVYVDLAV